MTETTTLPYANPETPQGKRPLSYFGGLLGLAGCAVGMLAFLIGCMGYDWGFALWWVPIVLGAVGMVATILGGMLGRGGVEHTPIVAGLFCNLFALVGGLLECAYWKGWDILYRPFSL
jgi:hypothetical protein